MSFLALTSQRGLSTKNLESSKNRLGGVAQMASFVLKEHGIQENRTRATVHAVFII